MLRLLIACGVAIAIMNPTSRAWLRPHLEPVLSPAYEWSMRSRVSEIARKLEADRSAGRPVPSPGTIDGYVAAEYGARAGTDAWGTPFHLVRFASGMRVVSAGRDRTVGTSDDIRSPLLLHR